MLCLRFASNLLLNSSSIRIGSLTPAFASNTVQLNNQQFRTKVIYHLPRPSEVKRFRKFGYLTKLKTKVGRRYMMERILRGDKCIAK